MPRNAATAGFRRRSAAANWRSRSRNSGYSGEEFRPEDPIEIGALLRPIRIGSPQFELPKGTISGAPEEVADAIRDLASLGASHIQVRFISRSATDLCDQIEEFGSSVGPLLRR